MSKRPKLPCIALSTKLVKINDDPVISKIDSVPYIDSHLEYPMRNGKPMICIAQINMDHIFTLLQNKKSDKKIRQYFNSYPQTGLIQIYLAVLDELTHQAEDFYIRYIAEYDIKNHDMHKQKKLQKTYLSYRKEHGSIFDFPTDKQNYSVYITRAVYAYDFLNSTMQNHPDWADNMENLGLKFLNKVDKQDNVSNNISLGGFPYHLQNDMEFDENNHVMLLSIINGMLGLNIVIEKDNLENLEFGNLLVDLSY